MKKLQVKRFAPKSVFKSLLWAIAIPYIVIVPIVILCMIYSISSSGGFKILGTILYLLLIPIIYGLIFMLFAASYNWLAPKFGGLEVSVEEKDEEIKIISTEEVE